jgi:hypothetical protein
LHSRCIVSIWIDILAARTPLEACILSQTDSTSAAGWLERSSFNEHQQQLAMEGARHLAHLLIEMQACLYSQWIKGAYNGVSNVLSRDHHLSDPQIVSLITLHFPTQIPNGFRLHSLPDEIASWLTSKLQTQPAATQSPKPPVPGIYGAGSGGSNTSIPLASSTTISLMTLQDPNATASWEPLWQPCATPDSAPPGSRNSKPNNASPPWTMWHRPSGLMTGQILNTTVMGNVQQFYSSKSEE